MCWITPSERKPTLLFFTNVLHEHHSCSGIHHAARVFCCHCRRFWPMPGLHESCMAFLICLQRQTFQVMHVLHSKLLMAFRYTSPSSCIPVLPTSSGFDLSSHTAVDLHAQQLQKHYWALGPGSNVQFLMTCQIMVANSLKRSWLDISAAWGMHTTYHRSTYKTAFSRCALCCRGVPNRLCLYLSQ